MSLLPPGLYRKTRGIHRIGDDADIPLATEVLEGTLYYAEDTGQLWRSNGAFWVAYSAPFVTANGIILRGTRAAQPAANTLNPGVLYYVTDELVLERSDAVNWQEYSVTGAKVDIPFNAADFTGNAGAGSWVVDSGDIETHAYIRIGRTIIYQYGINTSTTASNPSQLRIEIPFTIAVTANAIGRYFDLAAVAGGPMSAVAVGGGNRVLLIKLDGTAWPNLTNQMYVFGEIVFNI